MPAYSFLSIGLDDVDSLLGGCTTHFTVTIVKKLYGYGGFLLDYPRLIRLNPGIPWKTRGNGSVALEAAIKREFIEEFISDIKHSLISYVHEENSSPASTQPVIIFLDNSRISSYKLDMLYKYAQDAKYRLIGVDETRKMLETISDAIIDLYAPYGRRGLVGALSAIGDPLLHDHTYELLVYRDLKDRGRRFKYEDYRNLANLLKSIEDEYSFAHIDFETGKVLVSPAGPDPVIMGIRGENPNRVYSIFKKIVRNLEIRYDSWLIYVTNQGTNEHLYLSLNKYGSQVYRQVLKDILIKSSPKSETGSHIYLDDVTIDDRVGRVYAYYETGRLREMMSHLKDGDRIKIGGGIKPYKDGEYDYVLNAEYLYIVSRNLLKPVKPKCPQCYVDMSSLGSDKGFRCRKCGYRIDSTKNLVNTKKTIIPNIILPPLRSIKHLSKPLKRYGREKKYRIKGFRSIRYMWLNES